MRCTFPWTGMLIDPAGYLTLCCAIKGSGQGKYFGGVHIDDVDDLTEFFNGPQYTQARKDFEWGYEYVPECIECILQNKNGQRPAAKGSHIFDNSNRQKGKVQYLEYTTSNVCNQKCVMCSSKFSTQWADIESIFGRKSYPTQSLSDKSIDKIIKILPDLQQIHVKGGEPFADMKNLRVLEALAEVNPKCKVTMTTNVSMIPKKFIEFFKKIENANLVASIDGLGKRYEWIRGSSWEKTEDNMKHFAQETGKLFSVFPTVSVYNIKHWKVIDDWVKMKCGKVTLATTWTNPVTNPKWASPKYCMTQEEIDACELPFKIKSEYDPMYVKQHIEYTQKMNDIRGFMIDSAVNTKGI